MRHSRFGVRASALAGASVLCVGGAAEAGQSAGNAPVPVTALTASDVERVVVTGFLEEDLPRRLAELGTRVSVVPATVIQNGGYLDVGQALQVTVPGLYITPWSGPFDYVDVSLQGSRRSDILWTVDGVRINNRLYAGTMPNDTLPASMIERIEVLEGPQSLFYGTQGIAGAINIVTKSFSDTPDGTVKVGGDTNGGRHVDGYFRDTLSGGHRFVVYGSADKSDGFVPFREKDIQPSLSDRNRSYEVLTIGGKYAYDFSNDLRFTISEQHTDAKLDFIYGPQEILQAYNERNEDILTAKFDYTPSEAMQFFFKGYYHWWYAYYTEYANNLDGNGVPDGTASIFDDHDFWGFTDYGINAMGKFTPMRGVETYAGYDFQNYSGNDVVLVIDKKTESVHAVFGEVATNRDLWSNFQLAAGFRYNGASEGRDATVWNVSARWDANEQFYLKGLVGTGFRLPTAEELFANDLCTCGGERGNPNTKPEESFNVNGSIGGSLGGGMFRWEAIGFYREIKNQIGFVDFDSSTNQDVFGNLPERVDVSGGELVLDAAFTDEFSANASFTVSSSVDTITDLQINRVPEQLAKFTLDYHPMSMPFGVFASLNYVGTAYDVLGGNRVEYGNYAVFDAGARVFVDMNRRHRVDIGLRNVFDEEYTTRFRRGFPDNGGPAYLAPYLGLPRTFYASYGYQF